MLTRALLHNRSWTSQYVAGFIAALILFVLDIVGTPLFVLVFLLRNHANIAARDHIFIRTFGPLFEAFQPHAFFWAVWQLARRVLYVALDTAFYEQRRYRAFALCLLALLSLLAHLRVLPYSDTRGDHANRFEEFALLALLLLAIALACNPELQQSANFGSGYQDWVTGTTAAFVLVPALALLLVLIYTKVKERGRSDDDDNANGDKSPSSPRPSAAAPTTATDASPPPAVEMQGGSGSGSGGAYAADD